MKLRYSLLALAAGFLTYTQAQVSFGGEPTAVRTPGVLPAAPLVVMPTVDAELLMAEDQERLDQGIKGPYRFGSNHMVDLGLENSGVWTELSNGDRVWQIAIECPGALSINFEFHDYLIPEGAQVFVYNDAGEHLGAFTAESSGGQHSMGVTQLAGDRITVEYVEPLAVRGEGQLRIGQVTHAYRDVLGLMKGLGDSGSCNNNVICAVGDPWRAQIRSVAMITVGGSGLCTGQLINNCANDGTPYFLTAEHCLPSNNSVSNWVYRFKWHSPSCTSNSNGPTNFTVSGSTLKQANIASDAALIEFNNVPPENYEVFYTGWDKSGTAPTASTAIHHPSGDVKKISFDDDAAGNGTFSGVACWRILNWEDGTTEGGSSGSGLWNQNGLLIGQLFGGQASCSFNVNDYYGKFSNTHPAFAEWLGNCGDQLEGYPSNVGIGETAVQGGVRVAPNPTNGNLNVFLPEGAKSTGRLALYDALGQLIIERNVTRGVERMELDLSTYNGGIYLLELTLDGQRMVERIVLDR